jgi:hypothetical protein
MRVFTIALCLVLLGIEIFAHRGSTHVREDMRPNAAYVAALYQINANAMIEHSWPTAGAVKPYTGRNATEHPRISDYAAPSSQTFTPPTPADFEENEVAKAKDRSTKSY